ncbi:hypothetical protein H6G81_01085 [Scytonema hofmannii FACHB-248]|uniref:Transposase n=1 Tax=Scytonema hofmannii FACHB-248 TaxID=1842502 RepID=A0ABR8GK99_9CYAN|nr:MULTISPECIES: hypothetical protein [Nostocales]MBD2603148.1 hypothetical protein [Scytonema hofmannii FACHB-248]
MRIKYSIGCRNVIVHSKKQRSEEVDHLTTQYGSDKKIREPKIIVETRYIASLHTQMPNKNI